MNRHRLREACQLSMFCPDEQPRRPSSRRRASSPQAARFRASLRYTAVDRLSSVVTRSSEVSKVGDVRYATRRESGDQTAKKVVPVTIEIGQESRLLCRKIVEGDVSWPFA